MSSNLSVLSVYDLLACQTKLTKIILFVQIEYLISVFIVQEIRKYEKNHQNKSVRHPTDI